MKKYVAGLLAVIICLFTSCGAATLGGTATEEAGSLNPENPVPITLWHYYVGENQQAMERAVMQFNQTVGMEQGVIVDPVSKGSMAELEVSVTNSAKGIINAEAMPDIFSSYPDKALEIDALGMVCDLNAYFTSEEKQLYVESFLSDGLFSEDRFLLVPIAKSTELLYVNATAWAEFAQSEGYDANSFATWESLYETARAFYQWTDAKTPNVHGDGTALMGFDSVANFIVAGAKQQGSDVIDVSHLNGGWDEAALRRIFDIYYKGMSLGYLDAVSKFRSDDIKSGDLIAFVGSSSGAAYFPTWLEVDSTQASIELLALPYPVFKGGEAYTIQQGAGMCVANSTPQKQAGAALFLKWFTGAKENIAFSMTTGYLPVQQDAYGSDELENVLVNLRAGDESQKNVAEVFAIARHQIINATSYAAKPFAGSYGMRSVLQDTLIDMGKAGKLAAQDLKDEGLSEQEILQVLDVDARFAEWMQNVHVQIDELELN